MIFSCPKEVILNLKVLPHHFYPTFSPINLFMNFSRKVNTNIMSGTLNLNIITIIIISNTYNFVVMVWIIADM